MAAREAMACGVPVIAARLGALEEAVRDGENGLLFDAGSAAELATILQTLDRDRPRLGALRSGIRPTDWITVDQRTTRLQAVLEQTIAAHSPIVATDPELEELLIARDTLLDEAPVP